MTTFTAEEVVSLNEFQRSGVFHPFTCGTKEKHGRGDAEELVATLDGWVCPSCDYTQNWAHEFMKDGSWKKAAGPVLAKINPKYGDHSE